MHNIFIPIYLLIHLPIFPLDDVDFLVAYNNMEMMT